MTPVLSVSARAPQAGDNLFLWAYERWLALDARRAPDPELDAVMADAFRRDDRATIGRILTNLEAQA